MDAAVLMNPAVDCNSNTLNAELEVKKLQELVRKLERQNEQLRTRAGSCTGGPTVRSPGGCLPLPSPVPTLLCQPSWEEPFDYFLPHMDEDGSAASEDEEEEEGSEPSVLDDLELLDLNSLSVSDEDNETWLYVLPKTKESSENSLSALHWCRKTLDSPKSEVDAARRSLSLRLEQVSRWRSSLSSPSPTSSPGRPLSHLAGVSPVSSSPSSKPCSTPQTSERHVPSHSSPLHPVLLHPVGKELSPVAERSPMFLPHRRSRSLRRSAFTPQSSIDSDLGASEAEDDSVALGYKLQDLTDVQVMARLQEESLRQDYANTSSALANRRSQSFTFQLSAGLDLEEEDEDDEDYGLLPPPQPRLTRLPHSHTFSSMRDWQRSASSLSTPPSTPSTPPYPSTGFTFQPPPQGLGQPLGMGLGSLCTLESQGLRPGSAEFENKLRRSMPNLVRAPSMPAVPTPTNPSASPCLLRSSHSFDSSSGLSRLQSRFQSSIPSPGQLHSKVQSVGNFTTLSRQPLKATAYVSPTIKCSSTMPCSASLQSLTSSSVPGHCGIPLLSKAPTTPRSGLPRPASFIGSTSSAPRNKVAQPARSLVTPPKTLSALSALRDGAWRDGCF